MRQRNIHIHICIHTRRREGCPVSDNIPSPDLGFSHYVNGHTVLCSICLRLVISRHIDWAISWTLSLSAAV